MIEFLKINDKIIFRYTPEMRENWIEDAYQKRSTITFKSTFNFERTKLIQKQEILDQVEEDEYDEFEEFKPSLFLFANLVDDYYKIESGILVDKFSIFIHKSVPLTIDLFLADSNVSVFRVIGKLFEGDFYLGGENPVAVPFEAFQDLLKYFPKSYERKKYVEARIASVLRNYLDNVKDAEKSYQKYLNNRLPMKVDNLRKSFQEFELFKYQTILEKLEAMLKDEQQYSEHKWKEEILQLILIIYPKYIFVFREVPIQEKISEGIKERFLDFLLVDNNGNVDIVEIKKPFENVIMTRGFYRDNYIPLRELSGTVMQIEKYIYYLNRWSYNGEKVLTEKYGNVLPKGFEIKITNPGGIIIMGRENNLTVEQKRDFEVVKRKYKNIVDIITYDSLLARFRTTLEQIRSIE